MPPTRKKFGAGGPQLRKKDLQFYLRALGVKASAFMPMILAAIENKWDMDQFILEVRTSRPFRRMFPGIPDWMAPGQYRQMELTYRNIAQDFGVKLNKKRIAALFIQNKSPEEWAQTATIFKAVQTTDAIREEFNKLLTRQGRRKLDKQGWFKFLARKGDQQITDLYEAASLRAAGLDIGGRKEAKAVARQLGAPGQGIANIGEIVAQVRALKGVVDPELRREGITDADLVLLEGGVDPKGIAPTVERIVRQRQSTGREAPTAAPARGGALTLFEGIGEGL